MRQCSVCGAYQDPCERCDCGGGGKPASVESARGTGEERSQSREVAKKRAEQYRWSGAARAWVEHPRFGAILVPHRSRFAALCCAADRWGCRYTDILDARVRRYEGGEGPPEPVLPEEGQGEAL